MFDIFNFRKRYIKEFDEKLEALETLTDELKSLNKDYSFSFEIQQENKGMINVEETNIKCLLNLRNDILNKKQVCDKRYLNHIDNSVGKLNYYIEELYDFYSDKNKSIRIGSF